jgi:catechol 2,3-dioxygenase-like lactoylglutathione lyase family enzyme
MAVRGLDHVLFLTDDIEKTKAFYCDVLGFVDGDRPALPFPGYWLYVDDIAAIHVADRRAYEAHAADMGLASTGASIDHAAFAAEGYEELAARLGAAGVEFVANEVPGAGMRQVFLSDPNGTRIELNVRASP